MCCAAGAHVLIWVEASITSMDSTSMMVFETDIKQISPGRRETTNMYAKHVACHALGYYDYNIMKMEAVVKACQASNKS